MTKKKEIESLNDLLSWREKGVDGQRPRKRVRRFQESVTDVEVVEALVRGGRGSASAVASARAIDSAAQSTVTSEMERVAEYGATNVAKLASSDAPAEEEKGRAKSVNVDDSAGGGSDGRDSNEEDDGEIESAAFGQVPVPDLGEKDEDSNLADVEPEAGMSIELRDPDFIWSAAKIIKVTEGAGGKEKSVTVRYDGWGCDWDETIAWPSARIARLFTYTKRVKCMAEGIISKKRPNKSSSSNSSTAAASSGGVPEKKGSNGGTTSKAYCSLWPCRVLFRMPHPEGANRERAEELLRLEVNVFVQPYGQDDGLLPDYVQDTLSNGGRWMHSGRLRLWKNDVSSLGILPKNFEAAHEMAVKDDTTIGKLPVKPIEIGSLLNKVYRVFTVGGEPINGKMYTGETPVPPKLPPAKREEKKTIVSMDGSLDSSDCSKVDESEKVGCNEKQNKLVMPEPPPSCPPPINLDEPLYPTSVAVHFEKTQRWGAPVSLGGNDLFLGSFPSQTHAMAASEMALASVEGSNESIGEASKHTLGSRDSLFPESEGGARITDYNSSTLGDCICAMERQWKPENNFSLHNWTMQHIRHQGYLREKREKEALSTAAAIAGYQPSAAESNAAASLHSEGDKKSLPTAAKSKRKQVAPRRVDLVKCRYI